MTGLMDKWIIGLMVLSALSAGAQSTYLRLIVNVDTTNAVAAVVAKGAVGGRVVRGDQFDAERKNREADVRTNVFGRYLVDADYIFGDTNKAETVWGQVTNIVKPIGSHGRITLHYCPLEGAHRDWAGCDRDRRAAFREFLW